MTSQPAVTLETQVLLATAYGALNLRQIDTFLSLVTPDVAWPHALEGTILTGHDQVRTYWISVWGMISPQLTPVRYHAEADGRTGVLVRQQVRDLQGAMLVDRSIEHLYRITDGKIAAMEIRLIAA